MIKSFTALILFLLCIVVSDFTIAQDTVRVDDSSELTIRIPDTTVIQSYADDPSLQYSGIPDNPNSLRDRILSFVLGLLFRFINNPIGEFIFYTMLILSVVGLVLALVNQLMGGELIYVFKKNIGEEGFSLGIAKEELENTNYDTLFNEAISSKDFHAATRFGYLIALKLLTKHELITWKIEKTNLDYFKELSDHRVQPEFKVLTNFYEFVEYGDFEIDELQFSTFQATFNRFKDAVDG